MTEFVGLVLLCTVVFTIGVMYLPLSYILRNWKRPPSRMRSLGTSLAWCFLVCFPFVMANGFLGGVWPHTDGYSPTYDWEGLILDVVVPGTVIVLVLGSFICSCVALCSATKREEAAPTLPEVGPSWSDVRRGPQNTSDVQPSSEDLSEERQHGRRRP